MDPYKCASSFQTYITQLVFWWGVINSAGRELWQLVLLFTDIHGPLPGGQLYFTPLLMRLSCVTCYSMWTVWKVTFRSFKSHCVLFSAAFVFCLWQAMSPKKFVSLGSAVKTTGKSIEADLKWIWARNNLYCCKPLKFAYLFLLYKNLIYSDWSNHFKKANRPSIWQ